MPVDAHRLAVGIRYFVQGDEQAVAEITRVALGKDFPPGHWLQPHLDWPEGFLVAAVGASVIGFLAGAVVGSKQASIRELAVLTEHRNQGIGTQLLEEFLRSCSQRGIRTIELEVRRSNADAIRFYRRFSFRIVRAVRGFYHDGEDAFKMLRGPAHPDPYEFLHRRAIRPFVPRSLQPYASSALKKVLSLLGR